MVPLIDSASHECANFFQDAGTTPEVNVSGCENAQAFVELAATVVVEELVRPFPFRSWTRFGGGEQD